MFLEYFPTFSFSSKLKFLPDIYFGLVLDEIFELGVDDDDTGPRLSRWCFLLVCISNMFLSFLEADRDEEEAAAEVDEEDGGDDEVDGEAGVSETPS